MDPTFRRSALILCAAGLCLVMLGWAVPFATAPLIGRIGLLSQDGSWLIVVMTAISALLVAVIAADVDVGVWLATAGAVIVLSVVLEANHAPAEVARESGPTTLVTKPTPVHLGLGAYLVGLGGSIVAVSAAALTVRTRRVEH